MQLSRKELLLAADLLLAALHGSELGEPLLHAHLLRLLLLGLLRLRGDQAVELPEPGSKRLDAGGIRGRRTCACLARALELGETLALLGARLARRA